ncbi:MAG: cbb3-type cytochrome c oxidase N-terminal domain-containing protein [Ferruginibacter sp.]
MFFKSIKNKIALTVMAMCLCGSLAAQDTKAVAATSVSGYNQLATLMVIMIVVLAFIIWGMGQVLTAVGRQLLDKDKKEKKLLSVLLLIGFSLLSQMSFAQDAATAVVQTVPNYGGLSRMTFYIFIIVLSTEVIIILFMAFSISRMYNELMPKKVKPVKEASKFASIWKTLDKKLFTKAVSVEKEADILLDHDYDGIRELDNALPPWWKYGFIITIGIAVVYLLNFHVFHTGLNPTQEYNVEMAKAKIEKEEYQAKNKDKIDDNNVPMADADGIKAGQTLFEANCAACHLKDGGGTVGPNLTDNYWLHKGSLNDVYHTITTGYPDKGMPAWNDKFTAKEISFLASFVKSLKGTKPAVPKDPQGDMYDDIAAGKTDSAAVKK